MTTTRQRLFEVTERYVMARSYSNADVAAARALRDTIRQRLDTLLTDDAVVCLPPPRHLRHGVGSGRQHGVAYVRGSAC
jgi:hypothetical protein